MQQPEVEDEAGPAGRLAGSVRGLLTTLLAIGRTRLELLTVEAQLEIRRLAGVLILGVITVYAIGSALLMAGLAVVLAYWDSHRVLAAVLVACGFLAIAAGTGFLAARRLRAAPRFLEGTFAELARDAEQLRGGS